MLVVLTGLLTFVMLPLRQLAREVGEVESGRRGRLSGGLPSELVGLARSLNALIETERRRQTRYRHHLDDLAHALKTPLAAMRSILGERGTKDSLHEGLDREVERMDQRVSYQLRRARASGATGLGVEPVPARPLIADIINTLDKVYLDKQVRCELEVPERLSFFGDPGDLSEVVGNLVENAYKYCRQQVTVSGRGVTGGIELLIDDDGPGIDPDVLEQMLERGARADESIPGQGIGLAVVRETVELYDGELALTDSALGGARVRVVLRRPGYAA